MKETDINLLLRTANVFGNPRFMNRTATSPNTELFAMTVAQVK